MRTSQFPISTLRETPADAEIISHKLMLKAGLVRRLSSGLYTWMPYGLKVLRKVENIIREEMNNAGAIELLMPSVQPSELWQESGRWEQYGSELLRLKDRHNRDFCYGPTHEEIITDYARKELKSYKQLPVNFYQIQTKFRDEVRPRFGIMRAREFLMKDAYSFHLSQESLQETYDAMHTAYSRIFTRLGLNFRPVKADTGSIGGNDSHEFHVLADSGEDAIAFSNQSDYAANVELASTLPSTKARPAPTEKLQTIDTPDQHSIDSVSKFLNKPASQVLKTLLVEGENDDVIALVLRGDHELNEIKAEKLAGVSTPLRFADPSQIEAAANCQAGSIGPVGLKIKIIADYATQSMSDFVCGANHDGQHLTGVNWERDLPKPEYQDLRNVVEGDPSPDGKGHLSIVRGIEVGHIFQLGKKYADAMNASVLNENGKAEIMTMGCYGIGVSRVVAAAIEQNYDDLGILWPESIAPFQWVIAPLNYHKSEAVQQVANTLYKDLKKKGIEVLLDDRNIRPGAMFSDHELIGLPHRIVISDRGLKNNEVEYKARKGGEAQHIATDQILPFIEQLL